MMPSNYPKTVFLMVCFMLMFLFHDNGLAQKKGKLCSKCKTTGKIENPFFTEAIQAMEKQVKYCSYVFEKDKKGHGFPWYPCERCRNKELKKAAQKEFDELVRVHNDWIQARKARTAFLKKPRSPLLFLETDHFVITWNIPRLITDDKKKLNAHQAVHLYAERMEAFYDDFQKTLHITEDEMRNKKHYLYIFETQKLSLKASQELTGLTCWNAAKLPGNPSILITWKYVSTMPDLGPGVSLGNNILLKSDSQFHRHLVHHVCHLLNVAYYRMEWLASFAGWADEGLSHYFEMKYFDIADNTCDEEGEEEEMSYSDWEYEVKRDLIKGKLGSFADLSIKTTTALHGDDHKLAWSYVDFLMHKAPEKFKLFMKGIKNKKHCREALKESYGLSFIGLQTQWEAYVRENYRDKPLKRKR